MENKKMIKNIILDILKGGFGVVLPTLGMIAVVYFLYDFALLLLSPATLFLNKVLDFPEYLTDVLTFIFIMFVCFVCGLFLKTNFGNILYGLYEKILKKIKLYKIFKAIKEIYEQLTSDNLNAFKEYVLIYPFGKDNAGLPAFIVDDYEGLNGKVFVVFAPTVPNPTSGLNYHITEDLMIRYPDISIEAAFKSIISCGVGTKKVING